MKKYECMKCGTKQKIKSEQIVRKPREGHMTNSTAAPCAKCKRIEFMFPLSKD